MLGVGRYQLEGNFMRDDKGWGDGNLTCTAILFGSPGTPLVGLNRESMVSNFDISEVTRFKIGDEQHTPLHLIVFEVT